jgi:hypothetical protein
MAAKTKRAQKVRGADEFDTGRLARSLAIPKGSGVALTSWTLAQIFSARDDQLRGHFLQPARMAESMRTDDALSVAHEGRLAPQRCIKVEMVPAKGARGLPVASEADALFGQHGVGLNADTVASIHSCLTDHDLAFATCTAAPRGDGSRIDTVVNAWPIEHVRWDAYERCYKTRTADGIEETIVHGDGRWVVFQRYEQDPFKHATLLAAALVWARHAYAIRDWAKGSVAHGSAKVIGALPDGVALQDSSGALTADASALADALRAIATSDSAVVVKPAGSTIEFLTSNSTAWQVWERLVLNAEAAAARIYLGTDGTLGSKGGAPGVDVQALFGVASTKVEGDLACITSGLQTGVIEPWCAMNFGDSALAPTRRYMLPDADADAARASEEKRTIAFFDEIDRTAKRFEVTQKDVERIAKKHGVDAPMLKAVEGATATAPAALRSVQ